MTMDTPPFFIVGAPRSGTTMLRLMLNAHPEVCVPGESHFVLEIPESLHQSFDVDAAWNALRDHRRYREWELDDHAVRAAIDAAPQDWHGFFEAVYTTCAVQNDATRWGDKTPIYARNLQGLHAIFPEAVIIHIVRDGRDVVCSLRSVEWFTDDVIDCADRWRDSVNLAHTQGTSCFGDRYTLIRYEDLVEDPTTVLHELCATLNLPYDSAMLQFHESADQYISADRRQWHARTTEKVNNAAIGRYRNELSHADLALAEAALGPSLTSFGYTPETRPSLATRIRLSLRRIACALGLHQSTAYRGYAGHTSTDTSGGGA